MGGQRSSSTDRTYYWRTYVGGTDSDGGGFAIVRMFHACHNRAQELVAVYAFTGTYTEICGIPVQCDQGARNEQRMGL